MVALPVASRRWPYCNQWSAGFVPVIQCQPHQLGPLFELRIAREFLRAVVQALDKGIRILLLGKRRVNALVTDQPPFLISISKGVMPAASSFFAASSSWA